MGPIIGPGLDFESRELLEFSAVPSNPEALVAASAAGIDTAPLKAWALQILHRDKDSSPPLSPLSSGAGRGGVRGVSLLDRELVRGWVRQFVRDETGSGGPSSPLSDVSPEIARRWIGDFVRGATLEPAELAHHLHGVFGEREWSTRPV